jgi:hypothetical protein
MVCHVNIWFEQTIVLNDFTLVGKVEVPDFVSLRLNVYFTFFFSENATAGTWCCFADIARYLVLTSHHSTDTAAVATHAILKCTRIGPFYRCESNAKSFPL